jgi:chemotaxis protein MotD
MTEGVTQAAMPLAVRAPSAGRQGHRDEHAAGAFDEALGAPKNSHRAESGAGAKTKPDAWRHAGMRSGTGAAALDGAMAEQGDAAKKLEGDSLTLGLAASLDQPAEGSAPEADPAKIDADDGLPTHMRAEQAISAIMTIVPIARQSVPHLGHAVSKEGKADATEAEATASNGSKAALAAGAKPEATQQSAAHDVRAGQAAAAKRGTQPQNAAPAAPVQTAATPEHQPAAPRNGKSEAARQAGPQAEPADAADPANGKSTVAVPGQARSGGGDDGADTRQGGSDGRGAAREFRRGDQISVAAKVSIIAEQAAPAPATPALSANAVAIVSAVGAESGWRAAAHLSSALLSEGQNSAQPMRELKIQLHPLDLGVVTAHLRTVGEKLSVELKVDNHQAYDRLNADSDAIIKSLRSLGFDIDSVSIQQPQAAATAVPRSDASAGTSSFSRDTPSFQPGNSGSGSERFGGQASGRGEHGGTQGNDAAQPLNQNRAGSSLYI